MEFNIFRWEITLWFCLSSTTTWVFIIPWRTSVSSFEQLTRTWSYPSCTCEQSLAQEDHLGSGQSAMSKSTAKPKSTAINHHHLTNINSLLRVKKKKNSKRDTKAQTLDMVRAGLHCSFRISRQMLPLLLMFGWYTLVLKDTCKSIRVTHIIRSLTNVMTMNLKDDLSYWEQKKKTNLWWLERIIRRKVNGNQKDSSSIGTVRRSHDSCLPMEHVLSHRTLHQ